MKVLLVNCVYGYGSTGKIISDIVRGFSLSDITPIVAYGRGVNPLDYDVKIIKLAPEWIMKLQSLTSKLTGYGYDCSPFSTSSLFALIKQESPDIVNLHCINANTVNLASTIEYLKRHHIKTILTVHAEFPYTGGCSHAYDCEQWKSGCEHCPQFKSSYSQLPISFYFDRTKQQWWKLFRAYKDFNELTIVCVSPWLAKRAKQSPFYVGRKIVSINNGLNTDVFHPRNCDRIQKLYGLNNKKVILHVTPDFYSSLKGGQFVLELARRLWIDHPDYRIIVCGYNGNGHDLAPNIIPIRYTRDQEELAEFYSLADITLLTSRRETFSMVVAESLCCGTPVIGFTAGGPESIALADNSLFIPYGNLDTLYNELIRVVESGELKVQDPQCAIWQYSSQAMADKYQKLYKELCK